MARVAPVGGDAPEPSGTGMVHWGMDGYGPSTYGDRIADVYDDDWYGPHMNPTAAVGWLASTRHVPLYRPS